eukprot:PhF_6_TR6152/c1_g1_i2/m.9147
MSSLVRCRCVLLAMLIVLVLVLYRANSDTPKEKRSNPFPSSLSDQHRRVLDALKDQHILMIGDSLQRYLYLNLVNYLEHGVWSSNPQYEWEKNFPSWMHFFQASNQNLRGHELCDCHRLERNVSEGEYNWSSVRENRYYHTGGPYNVRVTFLMQLGHHTVTLQQNKYQPSTATFENFGLWKYAVCTQKPTVVILNHGLWSSCMVHPGWFHALSSELLSSCNDTGNRNSNPPPRLVWRTSLPTQGCIAWVQNAERNVALYFKDPPWLIVDTGDLVYQGLKAGCPASSVFVDAVHVASLWNSVMNQKLLREIFGITFDG